MWWIALAAITTPPSAAPDNAPIVSHQAQAVVRIVRPARIRLGEAATDDSGIAVPVRKTHFRDADGSVRPARLVEFS